ncbi:hypothetical protein BD311DRAFT_756585 [Dichomitus squalens]|uniref:Uncharacterized protein n=1 Tax=Dichomitus squalens TaxID=114155 RepID=A0A4Q9MP00_9APHY|nr:hypothetical protein BD311DRAFT_756585 [Dichomitus squalens]
MPRRGVRQRAVEAAQARPGLNKFPLISPPSSGPFSRLAGRNDFRPHLPRLFAPTTIPRRLGSNAPALTSCPAFLLYADAKSYF